MDPVTPVERRETVAEGVTLALREWEPVDEPRPGAVDDAGQRWLCVHGLASNARTWDVVANRLHALGHHVVAVDLRGHGQSDKTDDGYDFATLAADLVAVLDALGWKTAGLVGQSTGGNLVIDLAARAPNRVSAVVGVDGGAIDLQRRWPRWEDCAEALAPPRIEGTPRADVEKTIGSAHPDWSEAAITATLANYETLPDGTVRPWLTYERHLRLLRSLWEHRPTAALSRLDSPVLLLSADTGDEWTAGKRAEVEAASAASPALTVRWLSPADHDVHVQQPRVVADLIHETGYASNGRNLA